MSPDIVKNEEISSKPAEIQPSPDSAEFLSKTSTSLMENLKGEDSDMQNGSLSHFFPFMEETKLQNALKTHNSEVSNSVHHKVEGQPQTTVTGISQGSVLHAPLFPTIFGGTVYNTMFSRSQPINGLTMNVLRHPFGLFAHDGPFRFSPHLHQFSTQNFYDSAAQTFNWKMTEPVNMGRKNKDSGVLEAEDDTRK